MYDSSIVGQDRLISYLTRVVGGDRMPHAMLFFGPDGVGKVAAALETAKALHCERPEGGACGDCSQCRKLAEGNHPDFSVLFPIRKKPRAKDIDPVEEREGLQKILQDPYFHPIPEDSVILPIDLVRRLRNRFGLGTFEGAWRTAVIVHAERMRPEAANALLKTLEEPPPNSLIILLALEQNAILPTIVSRCQAIKFQPLSTQDVVSWLRQRYEMADDQALFVARASGGSLRRARDLAEGDAAESQGRAVRFLQALVSDNLPQTYLALEQLAADRSGALNLLADAELWLRDALLYSQSGMELAAHQGNEEDIRDLCGVLTPEAVEALARRIEAIREMNRRNVSTNLALMSLWREARRVSKRPSAPPA